MDIIAGLGKQAPEPLFALDLASVVPKQRLAVTMGGRIVQGV